MGSDTEVLAHVDAQVSPVIEGICESQAPIPAMHAILAGARLVMTGGSQPAGCAVAAITLAEGADGVALRSTAQRVFGRWQRSFRECLLRGGVPGQRAAELATLLIAGLEGALVLCRAEGSTEPLDRVAAAMEYALRT